MGLITIAAYQFVQLKDLPVLRADLKEQCLEWDLKGTILLAPEGINCFISGEPEKIALFKNYLEHDLKFTALNYKENACSKHPFTRMLVKLKKEIISMGLPDVDPNELTATYLEPSDLKRWIDEGKDFVLLDTRNHYEVGVGTFKGAVDLDIECFRSFPEVSEALPEDYKEKPVVMFCTGGIRCEKASNLFMKRGYKEVYQLKGGILNYFEKFQSEHYEGDCFVFDWRLAVDGNLKPVPTAPLVKSRHKIKNINS